MLHHVPSRRDQKHHEVNGPLLNGPLLAALISDMKYGEQLFEEDQRTGLYSMDSCVIRGFVSSTQNVMLDSEKSEDGKTQLVLLSTEFLEMLVQHLNRSY